MVLFGLISEGGWNAPNESQNYSNPRTGVLVFEANFFK